jgi:hypothetical protein
MSYLIGSLKGYHTPARGQSRTTHAPVPVEGLPTSCRVVGLRQTDGMPHAPSIEDRQ